MLWRNLLITRCPSQLFMQFVIIPNRKTDSHTENFCNCYFYLYIPSQLALCAILHAFINAKQYARLPTLIHHWPCNCGKVEQGLSLLSIHISVCSRSFNGFKDKYTIYSLYKTHTVDGLNLSTESRRYRFTQTHAESITLTPVRQFATAIHTVMQYLNVCP